MNHSLSPSSLLSRRFISTVLKIGAVALVTASSAFAQSLIDFQTQIAFPSDNGAAPLIWYQTAANVNSGTGATTLKATSGGQLTVYTTDYFGNASSAFGLSSGVLKGAGIVGSGTSPYLTGTTGTLVMMFQTSADVTNPDYLINRGNATRPAPFELTVADGALKATMQNDSALVTTTDFGPVAANTWYYVAVQWNLGPTSEDVRLSYAAAGSPSLISQTVSSAVFGDSTQSIFIAGRGGVADGAALGIAYQDIAIYNRYLSDAAIADQFAVIAGAAIPEPSTYALFVGLGALLVCAYRRSGQRSS